MLMRVIYENKVLAVGEHVQDFRAANMLIIFGASAPAELKDYCYLVNVNPIDGDIAAGDILRVDDGFFKITSVGAEVPVTLKGLGHCTISFTGETAASMVGTIYVEKSKVPALQAGSVIQIIKYK